MEITWSYRQKKSDILTTHIIFIKKSNNRERRYKLIYNNEGKRKSEKFNQNKLFALAVALWKQKCYTNKRS